MVIYQHSPAIEKFRVFFDPIEAQSAPKRFLYQVDGAPI